jgi:p-aminobenzoyl-glutamate transporter AbgT
MLTGVYGILVKEIKNKKILLENLFFIFLKIVNYTSLIFFLCCLVS